MKKAIVIMSTFTVDLCLFDLDGTIVSTTIAVERAWIKFCKKHNVNAEELFEHSHGARSGEIMARFFPHVDNTDNKATKELELSMAYDNIDTVSLIPGSEKLLLALDKATTKDATKRKWAIVTSGSPYLAFSWFDTILKDVGKPDVFITGFDVEKGKPDPEGYGKARDQLCKNWGPDNKHVRTVVFEDAPVGIKAGKAIGAITVGITSTYDKNLLFDAGADYVVADLTHVSVIPNADGTGITLKVTDPLTRD